MCVCVCVCVFGGGGLVYEGREGNMLSTDFCLIHMVDTLPTKQKLEIPCSQAPVQLCHTLKNTGEGLVAGEVEFACFDSTMQGFQTTMVYIFSHCAG